MSKVMIKTVDGVEKATATVNFDLGKVFRNKVSEDGNVHSIVSSMDVEGMIKFYEQLIYEKAKNEDVEGYREMLEQYVMLRINKIVGMNKIPLSFNEEGNLEGLNEDVKVELKESGIMKKDSEIVTEKNDGKEADANSYYHDKLERMRNSGTGTYW